MPALGARRTTRATPRSPSQPGTASGNYFVIAVADADQAHTEANETNNTASAADRDRADLVVSAVGAPSLGRERRHDHGDGHHDEPGRGAAGASTTKLYLSTNTTFEAGDVLLGSRADRRPRSQGQQQRLHGRGHPRRDAGGHVLHHRARRRGRRRQRSDRDQQHHGVRRPSCSAPISWSRPSRCRSRPGPGATINDQRHRHEHRRRAGRRVDREVLPVHRHRRGSGRHPARQPARSRPRPGRAAARARRRSRFPSTPRAASSSSSPRPTRTTRSRRSTRRNNTPRRAAEDRARPSGHGPERPRRGRRGRSHQHQGHDQEPGRRIGAVGHAVLLVDGRRPGRR